ncbi:hypothetical protein [Paractinoplanes durhamensis]|uniref:hypothetical protein n=1 Tax=Paractinoplanes durhamensis TaxID=113563 RepID=UPI003630A9EF
MAQASAPASVTFTEIVWSPANASVGPGHRRVDRPATRACRRSSWKSQRPTSLVLSWKRPGALSGSEKDGPRGGTETGTDFGESVVVVVADGLSSLLWA